jgi:hypothetical protein
MSSSVISEKTLIPLSAISVVIGASMWLTSVWKQGEATAQELSEFKKTTHIAEERIYRELEKINYKLDKIMDKNGGPR